MSVQTENTDNNISSDKIDQLMKMTANDFALQSNMVMEKHHDNLKREILVEIDKDSRLRGERFINLNCFVYSNPNLHSFIAMCDRMMMTEFLKSKGFSVSEWNDDFKYPTIRW